MSDKWSLVGRALGSQSLALSTLSRAMNEASYSLQYNYCGHEMTNQVTYDVLQYFNTVHQLLTGSACTVVSHTIEICCLPWITPGIVEEYLGKECSLGHIAGPLPPHMLPGTQISPFGVIPKSSQLGKWRLIVNLSAPNEFSVNDCIDSNLTSLSYISVDDIIEQVLVLGKGTQLAKMDIESAFRTVPVHPEDRPLLGMKWKGQLYIDQTLSFGLRSAPKIFNSIADALEWIVKARGAKLTHHYLDNFIVIGAPLSSECADSLEILLNTCRELGIPVALHKCTGPTTCLIFLGILIDTIKMEISLPEEKLEQLKRLLAAWKGRKDCTRN